MVALLLSNGSNVSAVAKLGKTPLHLACQMNFVELAQLLIDSGAAVNARDIFRMTPLHWYKS